MPPADRLPQDHDTSSPTRAEIWRSNIVLSAVFILMMALFIRNANALSAQAGYIAAEWIPLTTDCFREANERQETPLLPHESWLEREALAEDQSWTLEWYPLVQGESIVIKPVYIYNRDGN